MKSFLFCLCLLFIMLFDGSIGGLPSENSQNLAVVVVKTDSINNRIKILDNEIILLKATFPDSL